MIVTRSPFRVSFFGGGTDHPEFFLKHSGAVLGMAIDKFAYVTLNGFRHELFDYRLKISYSKIELVDSLEGIEHNIFRECLKYFNVNKGLALHNVFDFPALSGLGTSSSLTVSIVNALQSFCCLSTDTSSLASTSIQIERGLLKASGGWQDQIFASYGGFNLIEFYKDGTFKVTRVSLDQDYLHEFEDHLLLMYTNMQRDSGEIVSRQINRIDANFSILAEMRDLVYSAYSILVKQLDFESFGKLLHESWLLKRRLDTSVSNQSIDDLYDVAFSHGALGGKLLGAGGGGFLLFFASPKIQEKIRAALPDRVYSKIKMAPTGSTVIFKE